MIKVNDLSEDTKIVFNDLAAGDYFTTLNDDVIWRKVNIFSDTANAIQITDNPSYLLLAKIDKDRVINKIEIASIDYRRIK